MAETLVPVAGAAAARCHAIENPPQDHLREMFESLSSEQMRNALEALPRMQIKAVAAMLSVQVREATDRLDAPNRKFKKLLEPSGGARDWDKNSGLPSSDALAVLNERLASLQKRGGCADGRVDAAAVGQADA